MRFEITLAIVALLKAGEAWMRGNANLSLFRAFMVSLQSARKTKNASLMNKSCVVIPCSISGMASIELGVSKVSL
jgi:3-polyprenyl-4-hydroxybenzoate decarboxylase